MKLVSDIFYPEPHPILFYPRCHSEPGAKKLKISFWLTVIVICHCAGIPAVFFDSTKYWHFGPVALYQEWMEEVGNS